MSVSSPLKLGLFILAYQVETKIHGVLAELPRDVYEALDDIVVIDNHSTDSTLARARAAVAELGLSKVRVISNPQNLGYGGSHKVAFDTLRASGMDYAILFHGDGQGDAGALRQAISLCRDGQWDFVIGSRFVDPSRLSRSYSLSRKLGNRFFISLQRLVSGMRITDPGSGEIAYSLRFLERVPYHRLTNSFHFTPQLLLYCGQWPFRFIEFPVSWGEAEVSSVNVWRHGWKMLKMLLGYRLRGLSALTREADAA